jgi:ADP-dependent NAD(P)H-hydrate dehydratase / NAD(P)H-hydrate epimerase
MLSVATTDQIRKLETEWIKSCNARWGQVLMEVAGNAAAKLAFRMVNDSGAGVFIFCGTGNNGGDGFVVARYLHLWNVPVKVFLVSRADKKSAGVVEMATEESKANKAIALSLKIPVEVVSGEHEIDFSECGLIVDALFGTGLDREIEGIHRDVIEVISECGLDVLPIDIPSGVNSDTGQIMGAAVQASRTITFGYLKPGLLCHPGAELAGVTHLTDIGLPDLSSPDPLICVTTVNNVADLLPSRGIDSNKGTFGTVLTVAGSIGMSGATILSSESSLRIGAGLGLLATPKSLIASLPAQEIIYRPLSETDKASIGTKAIEELEPELKKATAVVLGPGMSTHPETVDFVHEFLAESLASLDLPCIIDADALNAISKKPECVSQPNRFVFTPHPKELSRLMGKETKEIQADRVNAALAAAKQYGCVVVLKGSFSVIANPDGRAFINTTGNASMAKAGAGDVLSGIIGGLLAQGVAPFDAAVAGVYVHGRAGEIASHHLGMSGVLAGDIVDFIPDAVQSILDGIGSDFETNLLEPDLAQR